MESDDDQSWTIVNHETRKMFVVVSKSNTNNELFPSIKAIKGVVVKTVKIYVKAVMVSTAIVTTWDIYHKLSDSFKNKYNIIVYSEKADWTEDVWHAPNATMFVEWYMPNYDRFLILGGSKFIQKFRDEVSAVLNNPMSIDHIITVTAPAKTHKRKCWAILETAEYQQDDGVFNDERVNFFKTPDC